MLKAFNVYLGLGSNMGDRLQNIKEAIYLLSLHNEIIIKEESRIYETKPFGYLEQADFLNIVIKIGTTLSPDNLLKYIHKIENDLGRKRDIPWGPRTLDIDILLYGEEVIQSEHLQIPHPYITDRLFVLVPLAEIYKGNIPGKPLNVRQYIEHLGNKEGALKLWKE